MTTTQAQPVFKDSLELVTERVRALQGEKKARNEILVELNKLVHDPELFSQKQRANVVREVNKEFSLKVSMNEIKRAIKTVNTAKPEAATPVDGLSGNATLDIEQHAHHGGSEAGGTKAPEAAPAPKAPAGKREAFTLKGDTKSTTTTTQENNTMAPIKETLSAVSARIAVDAPLTHEEKVAALAALLAAAGATTEEARIELINGFIAANPTLAITWNLMKAYPTGEHGVTGLLVAYLEIDPDNHTKFQAYLTPVTGVEEAGQVDLAAAAMAAAPFVAPVAGVAPAAPAAPAPGKPAAAAEVATATVKERIMTTIRGNRETGFSSGVVAAATAVVGGGLEMAFKGSATIGSSVGTAVGATGAYFLGNASEKLMETETGRYMLAGAIGVVAGGLGSRLGRTAQDQYVNPAIEAAGVLENIPTAPAVQPGGLVGNPEALLGMFNL